MQDLEATKTVTVGKMRAMAADRGGQGVRLVEVPERSPGRDEVRVAVRAAAVNPADLTVLSGRLSGRVLHAPSSPLVLGYDYSGVVVAVGEGVTVLGVGDEVFGHLPYSSTNDQGTFAESVVVRAQATARKPDAIGHETAAAAATPGLTAMQALRDRGTLRAGGRAMVIGAAGGVGSLAVGIAKKLGATVTGVCSTPQVRAVERLGADEVVDRLRTDPLTHRGGFDVVFDTPAVHGFIACRRLLVDGGTYVSTLPSMRFVGGKVLSLLSSKQCELVAVRPIRADLELLGRWLDEGLQVVIDATYPVRDVRRAIDRMGHGGRIGRTVIDVATGW
jgi:NADPH:quinone reductase-like Zn-dependent oxidoreductase